LLDVNWIPCLGQAKSFVLLPQAMNWIAAQEACTKLAQGAHLATPQNAIQRQCVHAAKSYVEQITWTGHRGSINRRAQISFAEETDTTESSDDQVGRSVQAHGLDRACGVIRYRDRSIMEENVYCTNSFSAICERDIGMLLVFLHMRAV